MYRSLAMTVQGRSVVPPSITLQTTDSSLPLWMVVIVIGSVLFGTGIAVQRLFGNGSEGESSPSGPGPSPDVPRSDRPTLTNEERVVELLRANGGRMRQTRIVEDTGWSKSKVSMLLSEMDTDGTINKLRVGRENIISLPGSEPETALSSVDERS